MSKVRGAIVWLTCVFSNTAFGQLPAAGIAQKMQDTCTRLCHGPSLIAQQRLDVAGWTREVNKMVGWGAEIEGGDKEELVRYLAAQFNANRSRPSSSQAAPEGKGKDVFQNSCLGCHDATPIARLKANRDGWTRTVERMINWGAHVPLARKEELIMYLLTNFAQ